MKKIFMRIKDSKFCTGLLIYIGVIVLLFSALIGVLCLFLSVYEKNLPENVALQFTNGLERSEVNEIIFSSAKELSEFEGEEFLLSKSLIGTDSDIELRCAKKVKEYKSSRPVFMLLAAENEIGRIVLEKSEKKALFGLDKWYVSQTEFYCDVIFGEKKTYTVTVPHGSEVFVNGKRAGAEYLKESGIEYDGLVFGCGEEILCDLYTFENLFFVPQLSSVLDGEVTYIGEEALLENNLDFYALPEKSFILSVPQGAYVTVNGDVLPASFATKKEPVSDAGEFDRASKDGSLPQISYYRLLKNGETPDIKAILSGKELSVKESKEESGKADFICEYGDEYRYTLLAALPKGAELFINGVKVDREYISENQKGYSSLGKAGDSLDCENYTVSGLYIKPLVSARLSGKELMASYTFEEGRVASVEYYGEPSEALSREQEENAKKFADTYITYAVNGEKGLDINHSAVLALMLKGSDGYKKMDATKSSFYWVNSSAYTVDKIEAYDFIPLGEDGYFCRVYFSVTLKGYRYTKLYQGTLSLVYARQGTEWLVSDFYIDSTSKDKEA